MIETERLLLREYTLDDFDALYEIVSDSETMAHYPRPLTKPAPGAGSTGTWKTTRSTALACGRWC